MKTNRERKEDLNKPKGSEEQSKFRVENYRRKRKQPRKDSKAKRVNFDNTRESKFLKDVDKRFERKPAIVKDHPNDISWYSRTPELVKASGSIPFASILGRPVFQGNNAFIAPGVMAIYYEPMYGRILDYTQTIIKTSAFTQSFNSMYSFLVHANSRNYTYDPIDLAVLTVAGIEVFSAIAATMRAYGLARYYTEQNLYVPNDLLIRLGFDPDDFRNNMGQIWFDINLMIDKTKQIWIPTTLPLLYRRIWLNSNAFTDAVNSKPQIYTTVQRHFYKYEPHLTAEGGGLIACTTRQTSTTNTECFDAKKYPKGNTWYAWKTMINTLIDALIGDEDRGIIYGDILKAYGSDKIFALSPIDAAFSIRPEYNAEVLTQIENLTLVESFAVQSFVQTSTGELEPVLTKQRKFESSKNNLLHWTCSTPVVNFHQDAQPSPEQVMVATRLTSANSISQTVKVSSLNDFDPNPAVTPVEYSGAEMLIPETFGTEVVSWVETAQESMRNLQMYDPTVNNWPGANHVYAALLHQAFDWCPFTYVFKKDTPGIVNTVPAAAFGDYENYTTINVRELQKLHEVAEYSLYGVPQI